MPHGGLLDVRRHNPDRAMPRGHIRKRQQTRTENAVIICDENTHCFAFLRARLHPAGPPDGWPPDSIREVLTVVV
jgi:hypothetical protein